MEVEPLGEALANAGGAEEHEEEPGSEADAADAADEAAVGIDCFHPMTRPRSCCYCQGTVPARADSETAAVCWRMMRWRYGYGYGYGYCGYCC